MILLHALYGVHFHYHDVPPYTIMTHCHCHDAPLYTIWYSLPPSRCSTAHCLVSTPTIMILHHTLSWLNAIIILLRCTLPGTRCHYHDSLPPLSVIHCAHAFHSVKLYQVFALIVVCLLSFLQSQPRKPIKTIMTCSKLPRIPSNSDEEQAAMSTENAKFSFRFSPPRSCGSSYHAVRRGGDWSTPKTIHTLERFSSCKPESLLPSGMFFLAFC